MSVCETDADDAPELALLGDLGYPDEPARVAARAAELARDPASVHVRHRSRR
jgi:hypothetical protein